MREWCKAKRLLRTRGWTGRQGWGISYRRKWLIVIGVLSFVVKGKLDFWFWIINHYSWYEALSSGILMICFLIPKFLKIQFFCQGPFSQKHQSIHSTKHLKSFHPIALIKRAKNTPLHHPIMHSFPQPTNFSGLHLSKVPLKLLPPFLLLLEILNDINRCQYVIKSSQCLFIHKPDPALSRLQQQKQVRLHAELHKVQ